MSITFLPDVVLQSPSATPTQEPLLEDLPAGQTATADLETDLLKSFEQALRDFLKREPDSEQSDGAWMLSLPLPPPVPVLTGLTAAQAGKVLPGAEAVDGNGLPPGQQPLTLNLQGQTLSGLATLLQDAGVPAKVQDELLRSVQAKVSESGFEGLADMLQPAGESRSHGALAGQYAVIGTHTEIAPSVPRTGLPVMTVDVPVGRPDWGKAVGERIQWLLGKEVQQAELKLNPPHLGPLEVRISLQHDQANVSFLAAHAPTREALEASLPRLREMFGDANFNLVNVDVGQHQGSGQQPAHAGSFTAQYDADGGGMADPVVSTESNPLRVGSDGVVDDYA